MAIVSFLYFVIIFPIFLELLNVLRTPRPRLPSNYMQMTRSTMVVSQRTTDFRSSIKRQLDNFIHSITLVKAIVTLHYRRYISFLPYVTDYSIIFSKAHSEEMNLSPKNVNQMSGKITQAIKYWTWYMRAWNLISIIQKGRDE